MEYKLERLLNTNELCSYLCKVDSDFGVPLSSKVSIESFSEKLLTHGYVFVVKENNNIISCIGFYCNDYSNYTAYLPILSTTERARGKGLARLLVNRMIEECTKRGMKKILCDSINPHAIELYKSVGFIEYKRDEYKSFLKFIVR